MQDKISILIPAYNVEKYIIPCLESITKQTYPHFEIFVMDDGSDDQTYALLKSYQNKEPRLHALTQKNQDVTKTLNNLLSLVPADTDYLFYADADDLIHPQMLSCLLYYIKRFKADVAECSSTRIDADTLSCPEESINLAALPATFIEDMNIFYKKKTRIGAWLPRWNKLYRYNAVKSIRFQEALAYEDDYFYATEVNARIKNKVFINCPLYYYRRNPASLNGALNLEKYLTSAINRITLSHDVFIKNKIVPETYLNAFKQDLAEDAYRMIIRKNLRKNKDKTSKKQLFLKASDTLNDFNKKQIVEFNRLSLPRRLMCYLCLNRHYTLARLLSFI